jgi:hypothetical protein
LFKAGFPKNVNLPWHDQLQFSPETSHNLSPIPSQKQITLNNEVLIAGCNSDRFQWTAKKRRSIDFLSRCRNYDLGQPSFGKGAFADFHQPRGTFKCDCAHPGAALKASITDNLNRRRNSEPFH